MRVAWAGVAWVFLIFGCGSDDDTGFTDGNSDPQRAECVTRAVFSCTDESGGVCREWYSDVAADAITSACIQLGHTMRDEPCAADYSECCIRIEGSNDYPEGVCITSSNFDLPDFKESCVGTPDEPEKWCGK